MAFHLAAPVHSLLVLLLSRHTHTRLLAELLKSYRHLDTCPLNSSACILIIEFSNMTIIPFSYLRKLERSQYYLINSRYSNFPNCQKTSCVFFFLPDVVKIHASHSVSLSISFNLERASSIFVNLCLILSMIRFRFVFFLSQCCIQAQHTAGV